MKKRSRSNVLLVEILIAVLFFMLSATVLVRLFVAARNVAWRASIQTRALAEVQNVADTLYASEDSREMLSLMGFKGAHGAWTKGYEDYTVYVQLTEADEGNGMMETGTVGAMALLTRTEAGRQEADELFEVSYARYRGGMEK